MATTGSRIKEAREAMGLTQKELADKVGLKHSAIHKYEVGLVTNLKRETIAQLAKALDVSPCYLLCMGDEEPATVNGGFTDINEELKGRLLRLSPDEWEKVDAFVQGLLASRLV